MATESVDVLIEGGKATAAPPLGPALGPLGVNIGQVVAEINKKTESFKGMQVPVKVSVDTDTKEFSISIGTPPAASLILKEAGVKKGAGNPVAEKVADLKIEQIIKISQMKEDALLGATTKTRCKEIIGTCDSMGVMVEGMSGREAIQAVNEGKYDTQIESGKTELTAEELKAQEEEKQRLAAELEKRRSEFEATAKRMVEEFKNKSPKEIRTRMAEAGVPVQIINQFAPVEQKDDKKK